MYNSFASLRSKYLLPCLALAFATAASAQQQPERNYQLEDDTVETIDAYRKEGDSKDYAKMLALMDDRLAKIKNKSSYDYTMVLQFKAKIFIEKGDYARAIEPMEQGLLLSDAQKPTYLDERTSNEVAHFLAQLYFQETAATKDPAVLLKYFEKSEIYIARWLKGTTKVTDDGLYFYATVLYSRAVVDDKNIDKARVKQALGLIDQALHLSTHPKDNLYLLKLVCLQQLDRPVESAEIFEILLKNKPENKEYWKQLASTYLGMDPPQPVRAIVTLERAQALGLMNTPADNYSLLGTYFNEGQYEQTAVLLEKGFKEGNIENDQKNWELLAFCYQQLNRDLKAIDTLKRATKIFPKAGQLDFLIAQEYYSIKKLDDALSYLKLSVSKDGGTKPAQTYIFMAYIAYELKKLDIALTAANKAIALPDGVKEGTRFKKAVEDAIAEREEKLKKM